jgi:hypothetical protein
VFGSNENLLALQNLPQPAELLEGFTQNVQKPSVFRIEVDWPDFGSD